MRNEATGHHHRESEHDVHVLDESALYFAPLPGPPSARHSRGRAEAGYLPPRQGSLSGGQVSYGLFQQLFYTPA